MSTRSYIGIKINEDEGKFIYCHNDGYPEYNGVILKNYYTDPEKIYKLIDLGAISVLAPKIDPDPTKPHSFDYNNRQEGVVVAYGRDRQDRDQPAFKCNLDDHSTLSEVDYVYLFDPRKDEWLVKTGPYGDWDPLTDFI